jgi:uncharacterized protein YbjT (DUF2867 family)
VFGVRGARRCGLRFLGRYESCCFESKPHCPKNSDCHCEPHNKMLRLDVMLLFAFAKSRNGVIFRNLRSLRFGSIPFFVDAFPSTSQRASKPHVTHSPHTSQLTTMTDTKIITVIGATGAQGGGVVRTLSGRSGYEIRAITRDTSSYKAKSLAAMPGVTVVAADLDDVSSLEKAFEGAYGVFAVTNFWEHFSPAKELAQAENIAMAAKNTDVKHVVWSTLEHTPSHHDCVNIPSIDKDGVEYKVPHFDAKGLADALFTKHGVPTTNLYTAFYFDNLVHFGMGPKPDGDGGYALTFPMPADDLLPCIAAEDIGACAAGVFGDESLIGKTVGVSGENLTCVAMAEKLATHLKKPVKYKQVTFDQYRSFGFPGADDLGNMFQFKSETNKAFVARRDVTFAKTLHPELMDMDAWLTKHVDTIPME